MCYRCGQDYEPPVIQSYSFKPEPVFHGDGKVYLGAEIEVYSRDADSDARAAAEWLGDLAYFKEDSSIGSGFEIVTHPMTYAHAMERFPWGVLAELSDRGCDVDNEVGVHVHVSRAGFDGPAHIFRWMKLFYRNWREITRIADRRSSQWAGFHTYERQMHYASAQPPGSKLRTYAQRKGDSYYYPARYSAINALNEHTLEVRVFASTLDATQLQAYLALCAASVEYTRSLTVPDILDGGWNWDRFSTWVEGRQEYAVLHSYL